ncbi:MAG TPA: hypothetical protein VMZ91_10745 [Candidatus Paceibacterota bacterium]|nr:hypothetical protein [Candidatus Paceibacterota bacterium]
MVIIIAKKYKEILRGEVGNTTYNEMRYFLKSYIDRYPEIEIDIERQKGFLLSDVSLTIKGPKKNVESLIDEISHMFGR